MTPTCPGCDRPLVTSMAVPIVAASSLGPGAYHYPCARKRWAALADKSAARREETRAKRSAAAKARFSKAVQP